MRPRPDAAEKPRHRAAAVRRAGGFNEAAARCRGKTGLRMRGGDIWTRFNEAAARCRGKTAAPRHRSRGADFASMRPRPDAAEKRPATATNRPATAMLQ